MSLMLAIGGSFHGLSQSNTSMLDSTKKSVELLEILIEGKKVDNGKSTLKLAVPLKDIPVTVNSISSDLLSKQDTDDMVAALKNVNGINPVLTYGGFQHYIIRGFQDFTLLIDGFRDERHNISTSAPMSNLANVERIEVLKGPASVLYGHSALGGVINVIRKKATVEPVYNFSSSYGSFNSKKVTVGAGGAITKK
jgi:iron complex outermembrane recepter protein